MRYIPFLTIILMVSCSSNETGTVADLINTTLSESVSEGQKAASSRLTDTTSLKNYTLFDDIIIGVPSSTIASSKNNEKITKRMGFAFFESPDTTVSITVRKMDYLSLEEVKSMMDLMSVSLYKGSILRSEIVTINGVRVFVTDISGQWNGEDKTIGMFRYYFNKENASYNLLMKYPFSEIESTMELKENMLNSIRSITQNVLSSAQ